MVICLLRLVPTVLGLVAGGDFRHKHVCGVVNCYFCQAAVCAQYGHLCIEDTKYSRRLKSFIGKLLEYIEPISTRQAGLS